MEPTPFPGCREQGTLIAKLAGYRLAEIPLDGSATKDVALEPFEARALYAPGAVFEGAGRLDDMLRLIDRTEANAMVIDVKETGGYLYYETNLPEAKRSGADRRPIFELEKLLPRLKERGIYTIARMVVMKDNTIGESQPGAGGSQRGHRRALARLRWRHLARPVQPGRGRIHRRHRR